LNIGKIEITKERLMPILFGVLAVIVLSAVLVVRASSVSRLKKYRIEYELTERRLLEAHNAVIAAGDTQKMTLPSKKDIQISINNLTKSCAATGVDIISIDRKELIDRAQDEFLVLPIDLEMRSTTMQFASLLGFLEDQKKYLIKVSSFDCVRDEEGKSRIRSSLSLLVYFLR